MELLNAVGTYKKMVLEPINNLMHTTYHSSDCYSKLGITGELKGNYKKIECNYHDLKIIITY